MYMLSSGVTLKQLGTEFVAQVGLDVLLSRLPGGIFAGFVIGMESDQYESPEHREARLLDEQVEAVMQRIPGIETLSDADKKASRDAVKQMLQNPIIIADPTVDNNPPPRPEYILPGLKNPNLPPGADYT
jgi:hypothetical protein